MQHNLQDIGLQVRSNLANTILLENTHNNNLVSDISKVDYLRGNLGETDLQPLDGIDPFVDDIYAFGFCCIEQLVSKGRRVLFDPKSDYAKATVRAISGALSTALPGKKWYDISIQNTIRTDTNGSISKTIEAIERATNGETRKKWLQLYRGGDYIQNIQEQKEVCAIFVAKIDLSVYTLQRVEEALPTIHAALLGLGMGIYAIDYTRDFSGTMDRTKIVRHLEEQGFVEQGDFGEAIANRQGTILDNTKSVGNHVCTWVHEYEGHTIRQKLYNKFVCQVEAGKVQQVLGGHIAEYAACPNPHLRETFEHEAAKARGISRIEISIYGCSTQDPLEYAKAAMEETILDLQGKNLFYIQPSTKQWTNFAEEIDRCCVFVDHVSRVVSFCRYAHSRTGRLGGVVVPVGKKDIERVAMHTMADFGFQDCPIFRIDLLECKEKIISLAPLRCFRKERGTKTILCPARAPTKRYPEELGPSIALPDTKHICWIWREKSTRMGEGRQYVELEEMETNRSISMLPKRQRKALLDLLATEEEDREWQGSAQERMEILVAEREDFANASKEAIQYKKRLVEYIPKIEETLSNQPRKIYELEVVPCKFVALGYQERYKSRWNSGRVYVLQKTTKEEGIVGDPFLVFATAKLDKVFSTKKSKPIEGIPNTFVYASRLQSSVEIFVSTKTSFRKNGENIPYCPMWECGAKKEEEVEGEEQPENTELLFRENTKLDRKAKLLDFEEGEYICNSYSSFEYRGKERYILYLGKEEKPAVGYWIDELVQKLCYTPKAPMLCRVGKAATTPNGKKDRRIVFCNVESSKAISKEPAKPSLPKHPLERTTTPQLAQETTQSLSPIDALEEFLQPKSKPKSVDIHTTQHICVE